MPGSRSFIRHLMTTLIAAVLVGGCASPPGQPDATGPLVYPAPPDPPRFVFERAIFGTGSVRQLSDKDNLRSLLTGTVAREGLAFGKPYDVAVHQGRIYVTDTVNRAVMVLDFPAQRSLVIGDRGDEGDLFKPLGIAVDASGQVYVVDATRQRVQIYDRDGDYLRGIDLADRMQRPSGIDVAPDGGRLFVVDTGGVDSDSHGVLVLDGGTGETIRMIGQRGTADGQFNLPRDVHLGRNGLLYVTDGGNFRVQALTPEGRHVRTWGQAGRRLGQFSRPKGISIDAAGNVYVVDAAFGNFQIFNEDGDLLMFVGERSTAQADGKYMLPAGIDIDEDGRIYMVDQFFRKLDVYRPVGLDGSAGWLGRPTAIAR